MWPPAPQSDRACVKEYTYDDGSVKLNLKPGECVVVPIYGIHHDPQYYPDPERFDPERFSDENKDSIVPGSFIPFGVGPRNCIGNFTIYTFEVEHILYSFIVFRFTFRTDGSQSCYLLSAVEFCIGAEREDRYTDCSEEGPVHADTSQRNASEIDTEKRIT